MSREFFGGWETGNITSEGFAGGAIAINSTAGNQNIDRLGNSGTYCVIGNSPGQSPARCFLQSTEHVRSLVEFWDRYHVYGEISGTAQNCSIVMVNGLSEEFSIVLTSNTAQVTLIRGSPYTGTVVATSAGVIPFDRYFMLEIHFRLGNSGGLCEVFIDDDGTHTSPVVSFSGDTLASAVTSIDAFACGMSSNWKMDEYARNSLTLRYDGGSTGTPLAGETITGGTSGATAVITTVEGDATSGVLVLQNWSGVAFQNNEALTSASMAALVNAPTANFLNGFEPNSGPPGKGFVVARLMTGNGATTQLDGSDGNMVNNYLLVDDRPPNTTDYVFSSTPDAYDTYLPGALPSSATRINVVASYAYAARDGTGIGNFQHVIRSDGTDYFSTDYALPTSYAGRWHVWNVDPDTDDSWSLANVAGSQEGFRVRT